MPSFSHKAEKVLIPAVKPGKLNNLYDNRYNSQKNLTSEVANNIF